MKYGGLWPQKSIYELKNMIHTLYEQSNIKTEGFSDIGVVVKAHFLMHLLLKYIMYSVQEFWSLFVLS